MRQYETDLDKRFMEMNHARTVGKRLEQARPYLYVAAIVLIAVLVALTDALSAC